MSNVSNLPGAVFASIDWTRHIGTPSDLLSTARLGNWLAVGMEVSNRQAIQEQTQRLAGVMDAQAERQIRSARAHAREIAAGIERLAADQAAHFEELGELLDDRLGLVIDQLRVANACAQDMIALLRLPESQKQRQYHYEQGLRHYANARFDEGLFEFALQHLQSAEQLEPTDHRTLLRIGMVLLYAPTLCDLPRSEHYLLRAARFALVETHEGAQISQDPLDPETTKRTRLDAQRHAAVICRQLSVACLAQKKWTDALAWAERSVRLDAADLAARYQFMRALAAIDDARLYEQTRQLLVQQPGTALALGESTELLSAPEVQRALSDHHQTLQQSAVTQVDAQIRAFEAVPDEIRALLPGPCAEATALVARLKSAAQEDRPSLALALARRLQEPNPAVTLKDAALTIELQSASSVSRVYVGSGDVVVLAVPAPGAAFGPYGNPDRYLLIGINLLEPAQEPSRLVARDFQEVARNDQVELILKDTGQRWLLGAPAPHLEPLAASASPDHSCWMDLNGRLASLEKLSEIDFRVVDVASGEVLAATTCPRQYKESDMQERGSHRGIVALEEAQWTKKASVLHLWDAVENRIHANVLKTESMLHGLIVSPDRSQVLLRIFNRLSLLDRTDSKPRAPDVPAGHIALPAFDRSGKVLTVPLDSAAGRAMSAAGRDSDMAVSPDLRWLAIWRGEGAYLYPLPAMSEAQRPGLLRTLQMVQAARRLQAVCLEDAVDGQQPAPAVEPVPVPEVTAEQRLQALRDAYDAIPSGARVEYREGQELEAAEDKKFLRRKDYRAALAAYTRAAALGYPMRLGHPTLEDKIQELRKKVG